MLPIATPPEQALADQWLAAHLSPPALVADAEAPFSFRYGGRPSSELLPGWECSLEEGSEEDAATRTLTFRDPETGLEIRVEARRFRDFPAVDWVLHLRNTGTADTPILEDIRALDTAFEQPGERGVRVHHARGSNCRIDDFEPLVDRLNPDGQAPQGGWVGASNPLVVQSREGRSSDGALPFFRIERDGAPGVIGAVGWTGDVVMRFWRGEGGRVQVQGGMGRTHLTLHPGEEIRSPRILLLFFEGGPVRGHNLWRRLILAHFAAHHEGRLLEPPISLATWGENRAARQIGKIEWLEEHGIAIDNYWVDAGWHGDAPYQDNSNVFNSAWGGQVGNWWPNKTSYPDGMAPVGAAAKAAGMAFTLWFEPERVCDGTGLVREHREYLLGPIGGNYLYNLGDPDARRYLTDLISGVLAEGQVTVYRQDFNTDPAPFWRAADTEDRVGMAEIRHVEGLYAFWDELRARHPGLLIDNCSSGGRRIDIETLSRSIPLWQSDFQCFPGFDEAGVQGQTQGLSPWVPLHTGACDRPDWYAMRSAMGPGLVFTAPVNPTGSPEGYHTPWDAFPLEWFRAAAAEQAAVRPYFQGDFYPLLSYSLAADAWAAWQCDRPDLGEGCVVALRRPESPFRTMTPALHALEPEATYELRDADSGDRWSVSGKELTETGLTLEIAEPRGSRLIIYRRVGE